ncbi:DNA-directed RNA polymerase subunit P [Candidatus Bathyarchaeota archaeon]|nr:DNA-directed RNA polymerase subunit P [Candidatus Bathyarchaeota archaeon]
MESDEELKGIVYQCVRCGAYVTYEEIELRGGGIKCTRCNYRVLKKVRPPIVKHLKAE